MPVSVRKKALRLIAKQGIVRSRDLEAHGISRTLLARLVEEELLVREARGLYVAVRHEPSDAHTLVQVAKRVPEAVFCLLTALRFHELTSQSPSEVWTAIAEKARRLSRVSKHIAYKVCQ
jgi:predicted transcriptional regulator of viral defense system